MVQLWGRRLLIVLTLAGTVAPATQQKPSFFRHQLVPNTVGSVPMGADWADQRNGRRSDPGITQPVPTRSAPVRAGHSVGESHNVPLNEQSFAARSGQGELS